MGIENIKRWHWCIIGIIVGCIVASVSIWAGPKEKANTVSIMFQDFESQVLYGRTFRGRRLVTDIRNFRVHPAVETQTDDMTDAVTYDFTIRDPIPDKPGYESISRASGRVLMAQPGTIALDGKRGGGKYVSVLGNIEGLTTRQYVEKLAEFVRNNKDKKGYERATQIQLKTAWIEIPKWAYTAYGVGGFVVIGLIWPTILNLLIGAGLGRAPREPEYDLSRFKGDSKSAEKAKPVVTDEDMDKLKTLEEELEASLREGAFERQPVTATAGKAEPEIKKLTGAPLEGPKEEAAKPEAHKDFGADQGDYYPTEVHGKHK